MAFTFTIDFWWIPSELGGEPGPPWSAMRTQIRSQRQLITSPDDVRDASWEILTYDPDTARGSASCTFRFIDGFDQNWFEAGQQIAAWNGARILAVGKVR
jgi:hypothetical protein